MNKHGIPNKFKTQTGGHPVQRWSIGILEGTSPLAPARLSAALITNASVTDRAVEFVADPFLIAVEGSIYLFFEAMLTDRGVGEIAVAKLEGAEWHYLGIALARPYHLSYPQVFEHAGSFWMVPESAQVGQVILFESQKFPFEWVERNILLELELVDSTLFTHGGVWWMLTCPNRRNHDALDLYYAHNLQGPWLPHPANPIHRRNPDGSRPAGRVLSIDGRLFRFGQQCAPYYGMALRSFEITSLSTEAYQEKEIAQSPLVLPTSAGLPWFGMHHLDAIRSAQDNWCIAIDGWQFVEDTTN